MPMSKSFEDRLYPVLEDVIAHYRTPFHIYDEIGMRETGRQLKDAFAALKGFREFYAVKALPTPRILSLMKEMGFGFDCSSIPEILLSREVGGEPEDLMFTSNNTSQEEFVVAAQGGGSLLNLDDITLIPKVPEFPKLICFRYNPGARRSGNHIIGTPVEAKYGVSHDQIIDAYRQARNRGARRFGLHTMLASNELNHAYMIQTVEMLLDLAEWISAELDIVFEFVNIGGGLGIPYRPEDAPLDLASMASEITDRFQRFENKNDYAPKLYMESGRYMTGPHGALVTTAINQKNIYRRYVGVDACMSALMRPGMYNAYHHITVPGKNGSSAQETVDVVGALCENNDKFAIQRSLPKVVDGDVLVIHDTGAHGHAMGFNYNGRLRPKELLLRSDNSVELIRREENFTDLFATLDFLPDVIRPR